MSRRGRHTTTYNLSTPRNIAAFEQLIEEEDDEPLTSKPRGKAANKQSKPKRDKEKFFMLKEDANSMRHRRGAAAGALGGGSGAAALVELKAMFAGTCDPAVVEDVFLSCNGNTDAALQLLLEMAGSQQPSASSSSSAAAGEHPACWPCFAAALPQPYTTAALTRVSSQVHFTLYVLPAAAAHITTHKPVSKLVHAGDRPAYPASGTLHPQHHAYRTHTAHTACRRRRRQPVGTAAIRREALHPGPLPLPRAAAHGQHLQGVCRARSPGARPSAPRGGHQR